MSAAVMGARSFLKRPWDDIDQGACADVCSSSSAIDSEPRITLSASPPLPVKRDFTLASSTSGRGSSFGHDDTAIRPNTVYKTSTSTASSLSYLEDTVKRPRLLHGNAIGTDTSSLQGGQCVQKSPVSHSTTLLLLRLLISALNMIEGIPFLLTCNIAGSVISIGNVLNRLSTRTGGLQAPSVLEKLKLGS